MPSEKLEPIIFIVPGQEQPVSATRGAAVGVTESSQGTIKQSVRVGAQRGGGGNVRVVAVPEEDVVVLQIAGGPALMLHPETARDLMLAQGDVKRSMRGTGEDAEAAPNEVRVPAELRWRGLEEAAATRGATRGLLGNVLLSGIDVITGVGKKQAASFAASKVMEEVDAQVEEGVYALDPEALPRLKGSGKKQDKITVPGGEPVLVLVHGTFSNSSGTFSKLWTEHPQLVRTLFEQYHNQVYALEHATLGRSPIENALTLIQALPQGARLHLVTHSRGGLVAEVLARVCGTRGAASENVDVFKGDEYASQRTALAQLFQLAKERGINVERVVRVACPARGTLLASKRLDAYVSVLKWSLELAGVPVAPELIGFLGEVAKRRTDPAILPGLAAQIPDSPLVQWLNLVEERVDGELRVVAGDLEGDSVTSWLKTLLADSFYWTDNDLVVQTRSMYGGGPRAGGASFVLDQGGKVSHFNYFSNERTASAIVNALVQETPSGFSTIGPLSWAGKSATGIRGVADGQPAGSKPAVFLLPGILGSNLKADGRRIWLSWRIVNGLGRLKYTGKADGVEPDGPIGLSYDRLADFLAQTHEVIEFAFDWRRPMEEEAQRLAKAVEAALSVREKSGQPVRMVAHSMGGVVARTMQLERPDVWEKMMGRPGARLLMLGTPNGGSWAPMQTLSGDDTFSNVVVNVGAPFQEHAARELLASFPGFIQLQAALLDGARELDKSATWQKLADEDLARVKERSWWHKALIQLNAYRWGVPEQDVLDRAVALRKRLDDQVQKALPKFTDKVLLVVGKAAFTPDGYEIGKDGLVYLDAQEAGDGRVTLQNALLPGVRTWTLDCEHGSLPGKQEAFPGYLELLQRGDTTAVLKPLAATRGAADAASAVVAHVRSRPSRGQISAAPPQREDDALEIGDRDLPSTDGAPIPALRITVVNGNLKFVREPLLIGHYRTARLTGTEAVMDRLLDGSMSKALALGLYPDEVLTHQAFFNNTVNPDNPFQMPRPQAVIVAGLGDEGKLRAADLVRTVRQATLGWAQRISEMPGSTGAEFELAATLIGSGGTGISAGQSAQLVAQGVREANLRLATSNWPRVSHLRLIELYLDRATEAWRVLREQANSTPGYYILTETIQRGTGALPRPLDAGYRGADYDFITALAHESGDGTTMISYALDTKRARTELRALQPQLTLVRQMVVQASTHDYNNRQIGRSLFQLLVPIEVEPFLGGTTEMVIELNDGTAGIPWELLDTRAEQGGGGDKRPWAIRAKLLRKLQTDKYRAQAVDANAEDSVLVVGEPKVTDPRYPRLAGARHEALEVAKRLTAPGALPAENVRQLVAPNDGDTPGPDALSVINALLERNWRIVHISGHGEPPRSQREPRGVVLSGGVFLGPAEINSMRTVPELVFVNCCHLAARDPNQLFQSGDVGQYDRASFAAGVAQSLIQIGVRCVVAAGWAVEDGPAVTFATAFYDALLNQRRFIDAVAEAREAAYALGGNTWAAYQCYGDPEWTFRRHGGDAQRPAKPPIDKFGSIASCPALILALNTLEVESTYNIPPGEKRTAFLEGQRAEISHLESRFGECWRDHGAVAEAFASAWRAAGGPEQAMEWFKRALAANDSTASLKAYEQFANLRARLAWETLARDLESPGPGEGSPSSSAEGLSTKRDRRDKAKPSGAAAARAKQMAARTARIEIEEAIAMLESVAERELTMERASLLGSAYKRLALVEAADGGTLRETRAIDQMRKYYEQAEALGRQQQLPDFYYPALNRIAAELILNGGRRGPGNKPIQLENVAVVQQALVNRVRDDADFFSVVGLTELRVYQAIADRQLAPRLEGFIAEYQQLHARVSAVRMWGSVYDQARFVLPKYASIASAGERKAANELLAKLKALATQN